MKDPKANTEKYHDSNCNLNVVGNICTCEPMTNSNKTVEQRLAKKFIKHGAITHMPCYWLEQFIQSELSLQKKQIRERIEKLDLFSFPSQRKIKNLICKEDILKLIDEI